MYKIILKSFVITLIVVTMVGLLVGCGTKEESPASESKAEVSAQMKIIFIPKSFDNPYWVIMEEAARKEAEANGYEFASQAPVTQTDTEKQVQIVENAIVSKYDAILLAPSGSNELTGVIKKANEAGIPVLTIDTRINADSLKESGAVVETFIGSDNVQAGQLCAEFIAEKINGSGQVVILEGVAGQESGEDRKKGFMNTMKENYPDIEIVASQTANWDSSQAYNVTQNMLQAHPDIKAVYACNDSMAVGAASIIDTLGKKSEIIIVGIDGSDEAQQAIKDGVMDGTVSQYPDQMGIVAVKKAIELLNGGTIEANVPVPVKMLTIDDLND